MGCYNQGFFQPGILQTAVLTTRASHSQGFLQPGVLTTKSRVMPLKTITIPGLKLFAATISIKQDKTLGRELEVPSDAQSIFWTDSTVVLRYIKNETSWYNTFVANRVAVRDCSEPDQWSHVRGNMNPADEAFRGLTAESFLCQSSWLVGPEFL